MALLRKILRVVCGFVVALGVAVTMLAVGMWQGESQKVVSGSYKAKVLKNTRSSRRTALGEFAPRARIGIVEELTKDGKLSFPEAKAEGRASPDQALLILIVGVLSLTTTGLFWKTIKLGRRIEEIKERPLVAFSRTRAGCLALARRLQSNSDCAQTFRMWGQLLPTDSSSTTFVEEIRLALNYPGELIVSTPRPIRRYSRVPIELKRRFCEGQHSWLRA